MWIRDPRARVGTIADVNDARPFEPPVDRSILGDLLEASTALVDMMVEPYDARRAALLERDQLAAGDSDDLIDSLLGLAWFQQHQLALVVTLLGQVQDSASTVDDVLRRARALGSASAGAIGAAASLVGATREADEIAVASLLADAMATFDDRDLIAGSIALTISLSMVVADALDLDVGTAHRDMIASVTSRDRVALSHEEHRVDPARSASREFGRSSHRHARSRCRTTPFVQRIKNN